MGKVQDKKNQATLAYAFVNAGILFTALVINYFYGFSHTFWLVLSAFLITQSMKRMPPRHSLLAFIIISFALFVSHLFYAYLPSYYLAILANIIIYVLIVQYYFMTRPHADFLKLPLLFAIALMMTILVPSYSSFQLFDQIIDVGIGALIASVGMSLFFNKINAAAFRKSLVPTIDGLMQSIEAIKKFMLNKYPSFKLVLSAAYEAQQNMNEETSIYPEWVYQAGFNPGLRSSQRFFLLRLEHVAETLTTIENALRQSAREHAFIELFVSSLENNNNLLAALREFCVRETFVLPQHDFKSDIQELQEKMQTLFPKNLEALATDKQNLAIISIARAIKDMRQTLLDLMMALPNESIKN